MKKLLYVLPLAFTIIHLAAQVGFNLVGYINQEAVTNSLLYWAVAIDRNNKILVVGQTNRLNQNNDGLIARFNTDGELDQTFNGTGFINIEGDTNSFIYNSVTLQPDGKIVAVGRTDQNNGDINGLIARFNTDGSPDLTFNQNVTPGFVTNIPNNSFAYYSVALQADGKIIAVGQTDLNNNGNRDGLIARFNTDGELDQTFNETGFINTEGNTSSFIYNSVALQPDGKIVAVGRTDQNNGGIDGLIARFNTDGELDQTFNGTGFITNVPNNSFVYYSVAVQPDGKIVAVGTTDNGNGDGLIVRFNPNGELDQTFNGTGFITNVPNNSWYYYSVAVQPDGKIVAVGQTDDNKGLIVRYLANGILDAESNWNLKTFRENAQTNNIRIALLG